MSEVAVLTLSEFLLARIAEQEAAASRLHPEEALGVHFSGEVEPVIVIRARDVLAECAAKRAIVEAHGIFHGHECPGPDPQQGLAGWYDPSSPCPTLKHLAAVYADHDDYRDEWKP